MAIPAFFAVLFGPTSAGVGAALGTLIADSVNSLKTAIKKYKVKNIY